VRQWQRVIATNRTVTASVSKPETGSRGPVTLDEALDSLLSIYSKALEVCCRQKQEGEGVIV
jgi:hypothetical protein